MFFTSNQVMKHLVSLKLSPDVSANHVWSRCGIERYKQPLNQDDGIGFGNVAGSLWVYHFVR